MKVRQPSDTVPRDITFAGLLVISAFSMCVGLFLGMIFSC
jgi:hypothetical protein